jgi:hypothetical protein
MRPTSLVAGLTLAVLFATPARAQDYPRHGQLVSVGGFLGTLNLDGLYTFSNGTQWYPDTGPAQGLQLALGVTPVVSVVGSYYAATTGFFSFQSKEAAADIFDSDGTFEATLLDLGLQFRRPMHHLADFNPFAQVGVGHLTMKRSMGYTEEQDIGNSWNVGVGLDLQFGNTFSIRVMAKDYMPLMQWTGSEFPAATAGSSQARSHNVAWLAGITLGR